MDHDEFTVVENRLEPGEAGWVLTLDR